MRSFLTHSLATSNSSGGQWTNSRPKNAFNSEQYIFSSNQAPAILNSIFFLKTTQFIHILSLLESRTYVKRKELSAYAASGGSRDNFFLDLFHLLVKTLTMRDNELKSISSSLSYTHQKVSHHSIISSIKIRKKKI